MGFASINELLQQTKEKNTSICRLMMAHEAELEGVSEDAVFAQMLENWQIMQKSIERGIKEAPVSKSGLVGGDGQRLYHYSKGRTLCGQVINEAVSYAAYCRLPYGWLLRDRAGGLGKRTAELGFDG